MRNWIAAFLTLFLLGVALPASAQQNNGITTDSIEGDWNRLTQEQKAQLAQQIAQKAGKNETTFSGAIVPKDMSADKVEPWLKLVDKMGEGLVKLAHDLGVTANELLHTPVGAIAMGLVIYHVAGDQILEILIGLLWFSLTFPVWLLMFYKLVIPIVEYKTVKLARWGREPVEVQIPVRRRCTFDEDSGPEWVATVSLVLIFIVTVIFLA